MDDTNAMMCAHYGVPLGTPNPESYNAFGRDVVNFGDIHKSGPTLTELGYPKLEIIGQWAAVIYIGLIAAWIFIFS